MYVNNKASTNFQVASPLGKRGEKCVDQLVFEWPIHLGSEGKRVLIAEDHEVGGPGGRRDGGRGEAPVQRQGLQGKDPAPRIGSEPLKSRFDLRRAPEKTFSLLATIWNMWLFQHQNKATPPFFSGNVQVYNARIPVAGVDLGCSHTPKTKHRVR